MSITYVVGVDPGLVHTGVVGFAINPHTKVVEVLHTAVSGPDAEAVSRWISHHLHLPNAIFIEGYRTRGNLGTDADMMAAVGAMKRAMPKATVLQNTGVKKVVRRPLMEALGCWSFATATHHQDLRSAARIAILGMLKDEQMNRLLADMIRDLQEGRPWRVEH